jgi:glycosyltransferase involved in cell wall biosynthesis
LAAKLGIAPTTRFVGRLDGRERFAALRDADLVLYPGRHEVFGLVALEALLCGTPVIVAGDSGCGEVVAKVGGGTVVPPANPSVLASAMQQMLTTGASRLAARVRAAQRRARQLYSIDVVAPILEEVYLEVLGASTARRAVP